MLAAAALVAPRVRLGTQVATPNYRHPVPFAKEVMTLDQLCDGRLELGVGAGVTGPDAAVLGDAPRTPRDRSVRFSEWLGLLDTLLRASVTTVRGPRYSAVEAHQIPGCRQLPRVPFTVAATGPRGFALVAQYGQAWVSHGPRNLRVEPHDLFETLSLQSRQLDAELARCGRAADSVRRIAQLALDVRWPFVSIGRYEDFLGRLEGLGFAELTVHWCRPDGRGVPASAVDMIASALRV
jgi:alkanesulfonate monooxygenase SsuD/methylene tetrahydromethanopterin reductase-like flavin-dependent oxidoreductase (luciferase family)